ncbi:hypothetical protein LCGC14_1030680 [marine sediment metagenome]|uniref:Uncharacterized protein n=1 Tax=marine sediment metagenome TaxID=412755 RepID=A0A0F9NGG5_9ZZZZ
MTDRIHALTVVLERIVRSDDVQPTIAAIKELRNVADVKVHIADVATHAAETRARGHLTRKLYHALEPE